MTTGWKACNEYARKRKPTENPNSYMSWEASPSALLSIMPLLYYPVYFYNHAFETGDTFSYAIIYKQIHSLLWTWMKELYSFRIPIKFCRFVNQRPDIRNEKFLRLFFLDVFEF